MRKKIDGMLYERTAISKKPEKLVIKVAEYMTELPKRELLEHKLHKAVESARKRLEAKPA